MSRDQEVRAEVRTAGLHEELLLIERAADAYARARREVFDQLPADLCDLNDRQHRLLENLAEAEAELREYRERRRAEAS